MYNIQEGGKLKILSAEEKITDGTGSFYKFTIKDDNARTYVVKIDKPLPYKRE
jgi:hypothetical protein